MTDAPASTRPTTADARLSSLFPDPDGVVPFWRTRRARWGLVGLTTVALVASGFVAVNASGSEALNYRTAVAGTHDVQAVLNGVATVEAVNQAAVAFPISGTVASVAVAVGDQVVTGQTLATVDTASLERTLHTRQAALAQAELTLSKALDGEPTSTGGAGAAPTASSVTGARTATTTVTTAAAATATPSPASTTTSGSSASGTAATDAAALRDAQQAVLDAQRTVDAALTDSEATYQSAAAVCDSTETTTTTTTTSPSTTTVPPTVPSTDVLAACRSALSTVRSAQAATAAAQTTLSSATQELDRLLSASTAAVTAGGGSTAAASGAPVTTTTAAPASSPLPAAAATSSGTSSTPSSEQLIALQKAVDAAALDVIVATHNVAQTELTAPISGTVVAVGFETGESVTAASTTQQIIVVGDGGFEVTTTIPVAKIPTVEVGQQATVTLDGSDEPLSSEVVSISVTPHSASTSTAYRVVLALEEPPTDLHSGATGSVSIVTGATREALAVPTSAVTTNGTEHTVLVRTATGTKSTRVEVGVVGTTWAEITSGLTSGQRVVLADLDAALPGSATAESAGASNTSGSTPTGFPGGGIPDGGFPGGAGFTGGTPPAGVRPGG